MRNLKTLAAIAVVCLIVALFAGPVLSGECHGCGPSKSKFQ